MPKQSLLGGKKQIITVGEARKLLGKEVSGLFTDDDLVGVISVMSHLVSALVEADIRSKNLSGMVG